MNLPRKALVPLAGAAIIVLVLSIGGPRAVHAVVATLVQVVNTPSSPVFNVAAPAANQLFASGCRHVFASATKASCSLDPVPAGQTLFIETISYNIEEAVNGLGTTPFESVSFAPQGGEVNGTLFLAPTVVGVVSIPGSGLPANTAIFHATASVRVGVMAGIMPMCSVTLLAASPTGGFFCYINGYLAPSQ